MHLLERIRNFLNYMEDITETGNVDTVEVNQISPENIVLFTSEITLHKKDQTKKDNHD